VIQYLRSIGKRYKAPKGADGKPVANLKTAEEARKTQVSYLMRIS
jgi:hypothetical protein